MYRRSLAAGEAFLGEITESRPSGIDFQAFSSTVTITCSGYVLLVLGTSENDAYIIITLKYKCSNLRIMTRLIPSSVEMF